MAISQINTNSIGTITGINFADTESSSSDDNTLDDYEQGTYTPTITCSSSGTIAVRSDYNVLTYTKIGRAVFITGYIISGTVSSPVGYIKISLPFATPDLGDSGGGGSIHCHITSTAAANVADAHFGTLEEGVAEFRMFLGDGVNPQSDLAEEFSGNETLFIGGVYITA